MKENRNHKKAWEEMPMFRGLLIKESLEDEGLLDLVQVQKVETQALKVAILEQKVIIQNHLYLAM